MLYDEYIWPAVLVGAPLIGGVFAFFNTVQQLRKAKRELALFEMQKQKLETDLQKAREDLLKAQEERRVRDGGLIVATMADIEKIVPPPYASLHIAKSVLPIQYVGAYVGLVLVAGFAAIMLVRENGMIRQQLTSAEQKVIVATADQQRLEGKVSDLQAQLSAAIKTPTPPLQVPLRGRIVYVGNHETRFEIRLLGPEEGVLVDSNNNLFVWGTRPLPKGTYRIIARWISGPPTDLQVEARLPNGDTVGLGGHIERGAAIVELYHFDVK